MSVRLPRAKLTRIYQQLHTCYGHQHWWPGDTPFEIMVGAVLTQNTAWVNVERAIANLRTNQALDPRRILAVDPAQLAQWLRPSGYFNIKAKRLRNFCAWYVEQGELQALQRMQTEGLREALLAVNGIGPETADDILLYALDRPVFVIDAYTRRLFARLGLIEGDESYEALRLGFERSLGVDALLYNDYHAQIVVHAKDFCKVKPRCELCCLRRQCARRGLE